MKGFEMTDKLDNTQKTKITKRKVRLNTGVSVPKLISLIPFRCKCGWFGYRDQMLHKRDFAGFYYECPLCHECYD
jgi:hypothetical protein